MFVQANRPSDVSVFAGNWVISRHHSLPCLSRGLNTTLKIGDDDTSADEAKSYLNASEISAEAVKYGTGQEISRRSKTKRSDKVTGCRRLISSRSLFVGHGSHRQPLSRGIIPCGPSVMRDMSLLPCLPRRSPSMPCNITSAFHAQGSKHEW